MQNHRNRISRVEGLILARRDWDEADRMIVLFTADQGKLRLLAPGARKPSSRKSGHLELFTRGRFMIARGRTFDKITQAETLEYFPMLRVSLERISTAYVLAELVDRFLEDEDENALVYQLLLNALAWLEQGDRPALVLRFFELKLLGYIGYQPQLFDCQLCGNPLEPVDQFLGLAEGGAICPTCRHNKALHLPISLQALKVFRFMQRVQWDTVRGLRLDTPLANELERLLHRYATYHIGRTLKSVRFLDQVKRLAN
ncbi:MAG: DNA repair protein RecO [Ardenticatenaceae bacterium]